MEVGSFFDRARKHVLKPTIINENSNFVVITYWWGRGNFNKNTQRPCPEDREDIIRWEGIKETLLRNLKKRNPDATESDISQADIDEQIKAVLPAYKMKWSNAIKYEDMLDSWVSSCKKHNCNFLAEEYPEFAVKGGYQDAINFKPYFIKLALASAYPRGVLYIDGDMHIKKYPSIFDLGEVDYMARGWNTEPRVAPWHSKPCFDPYTFETSGGTMFFGNTYYGRLLLEHWEKTVLMYPGKADDRILALTIMKEHLLAELSTIQLPMEYLWMTLDFDQIFDKYENDVNQRGITITHPECLTGEERAEKDSGTKSTRIPRGYTRAVENKLSCRDREVLYEYIHFPKKESIGNFKYYLDWLSKHNVLNVVPYSKKYGDYNDIVAENTVLFGNITLEVKDQIVVVSENDVDSISLHKTSKREVPITILRYLMNGQNVVYVPKSMRSVRNVVGKAHQERLDFVTKNISDSNDKAKKEYTLKLDYGYPIYFGNQNRVLKHLLLMSNSIESLEKIFNESYLFLTRMHCGWL